MDPSSDIRFRQSETRSNSPVPSAASLIPRRKSSGSNSPPSSRSSPKTPLPTLTAMTRDEQWQYDYHQQQQSGLPSQPISQVSGNEILSPFLI